MAVIYDTNGDTSTLSPGEVASIKQIWKRVSEDMRPFNLDVTTERPAQISPKFAFEVCIGGSHSLWFGQSAGGVAYLYSWAFHSVPRVWLFEVHCRGSKSRGRKARWHFTRKRT